MSARGSAAPGGIVVALDTATPVGSVVVARGPDVLAVRLLERRAEHASRLIPAIDDALRSVGLSASDLTGVVVGEGPGSFTGVRVAAATAKAIAHARALPLWTVSSPAGVALATEAGFVRYVLFDARQDRVYVAGYAVDAGRVQTLCEPSAARLHEVLDADVPAGAVFLGDGAERHRTVIEAAGHAVAPAPASYSTAEGLLRFLGGVVAPAPVEDVAAWEPRYVRPWSPDPAWAG